MKYITFLSVPPPVIGFRDTQTLRRTAHCCGLCSVESHCWLLLLPPIDIYDWACGWGGHTAIEPSKTDLEPQFWTGNCLKWQLASLRGELHHLRLSNHPGQNSWNHNIYVCMYVDAQVLGVRLEYFISSKGEFAAGQLGGKILEYTATSSPVFFGFLPPGRALNTFCVAKNCCIWRMYLYICICAAGLAISLLANLCDVCTQQPKCRKRRHCLAANCF